MENLVQYPRVLRTKEHFFLNVHRRSKMVTKKRGGGEQRHLRNQDNGSAGSWPWSISLGSRMCLREGRGSQVVVSGTEARLGHGPSGILGRMTTEHEGVAMSCQGMARGWGGGDQGLIRTLLPTTLTPSQPKAQKRDFSFFLQPQRCI